MTTRFAGYPAPFIYSEPDLRTRKKTRLLWGDWVSTSGPPSDGWFEAWSRGTPGFVREEDLQEERLLEICFVDVGQGDGALIVTPDDKRIVVDAGEEDNLYWFLRWRFDLRDHPDRVIKLDHLVLTHSDSDHYKGASALIESPQFEIGKLHHNGLVERTGDDPLGPDKKVNGVNYQIDVIKDRSALDALLTPARVGRKLYPKLMRQALDSDLVGDISMLAASDGHLGDWGPESDFRVEVLGPVWEELDELNGKRALRRFDNNDGKTKNGHSVVLRFRYRDVRVLMGGDLNVEAQDHLLTHYGDDARDRIESDVAKSCHHGSSDNDDRFLDIVNPLANVVSSGDNEGYAHPRPDLLGALGHFGRGTRSLIFSTELGRSPSAGTKKPTVLRALNGTTLERARATLDAGGMPSEDEAGREVHDFQRSIATYGMINLRTDGTKVVMAQKLESGKGWDYHCLRDTGDGLAYVGDDDDG